MVFYDATMDKWYSETFRVNGLAMAYFDYCKFKMKVTNKYANRVQINYKGIMKNGKFCPIIVTNDYFNYLYFTICKVNQ